MAVLLEAQTHQTVSEEPEQRVVLYGLDWDAYETLGEVLRDRSNVRLTYDHGTVELLTTSFRRERYKTRLGRLVEALAEEFDREIFPAGSMTFKREDLERGLEPDECYWIAHEPDVRGRLEYDPYKDPPPDLVIEIEVTRSAMNRLGIYAALGVPEVWCFNGKALRVLCLGGNEYREVPESPTFPGVPPGEIVRFVLPDEHPGYLEMVRAFRAWVRETTGRGSE